MVCTAEQLGGSGFDTLSRGGGGFGGGFGGGASVRYGAAATSSSPTTPPSRQVATVTGGAYFSASDAEQLQGVLKDLPRQVKVQQRDVEVSVVLAGLAALLVLLTVWAALAGPRSRPDGAGLPAGCAERLDGCLIPAQPPDDDRCTRPTTSWVRHSTR